jgi:hypothetical protein
MRRLGSIVMVVATLGAVSLLGIPSAAAAPVPFSSTPLAGWSTNGTVRAVVIVGDTVYAGGDFTQVRLGNQTLNRARLAAWDARTGAIRAGFTADASSTVRALASDGNRLFVGGQFTTIKGVSRSRLASLDLTTGNVDTGFSANASSTVYQLEAKNGRLYVGGAFTNIRNVSRNRIAAVSTATGAVDTQFNPNANSAVRGIAVSPDGSRVYLGGEFSTVGGGSRPFLAAVAATNGALQNPTFQYSQYGQVIDLDVSTDGSRLFAGVGDLENTAVAWNTTNGNRLWENHVEGDVQAVRYHGGNLYFGFHEGAENDLSVRMLAADAVTGAIVQTYRLPINQFDGVWDIDASDVALVLGGVFTRVSNRNVQGVAILPGSGGGGGGGGGGGPTTTTLVSTGSTWRYLADGSNQGTLWRGSSFADGAWPQGNAELGYGDGDEATVVPFGPNANQKHVTTYFRRQFSANPATLGTVTLQLKRDDGAVVYLNGTEIARSNMPAGTIGSTTLASGNVSGGAESQFFAFTVPASAFVNGTNTLAVEVHQDNRTSSDLSFDLGLTSVTG